MWIEVRELQFLSREIKLTIFGLPLFFGFLLWGITFDKTSSVLYPYKDYIIFLLPIFLPIFCHSWNFSLKPAIISSLCSILFYSLIVGILSYYMDFNTTRSVFISIASFSYVLASLILISVLSPYKTRFDTSQNAEIISNIETKSSRFIASHITIVFTIMAIITLLFFIYEGNRIYGQYLINIGIMFSLILIFIGFWIPRQKYNHIERVTNYDHLPDPYNKK